MASLVEAMSPDSLTVEIAAGATLSGPIEIVHLAVGDGACSLYSWTEIVAPRGRRARRWSRPFSAPRRPSSVTPRRR